MDKPPIFSVFALGLGACALVVAVVRDPGPAPGEDASQSVDRSAHETVDERIDQLVEENRVLRESISMLENAVPPGARTSVATDHVSHADFEAFREEIRAALQTGASMSPLSASAKDAEFKDQIAGTLREIRSEEALAKTESTHQRRLDRLDQLIPKLEQRLGLTGGQSDDFRAALVTHYDRQADLTRRWQAGEDVVALGEVKRDDRRVYMNELSLILTPEQLQSFLASDLGGK